MAELDTPFLNSSLENIPVDVDMLDFSFVERCDDWKKLYAIFQLLKSGKEGHYPDLLKLTEDRMLSLMPAKEKRQYLALYSKVTIQEVADAAEDLLNWQRDALQLEQRLKSGKSLPERLDTHRALMMKFLSKSQLQKFEDLRKSLKVESMPLFQRSHRADMERCKGNEAFRAGEYSAAVRHYSNALVYEDGTVDVLWSNRAIAYIKEKLFDLAEADCHIALTLNSENLKARARRGFARMSVGKYLEAAQDYYTALVQDPGNAEYVKLLDKAREKFRDSEGRVLTDAMLLVDLSPEPATVKSTLVEARQVLPSFVPNSEAVVASFSAVKRVTSFADLFIPSSIQRECARGSLRQSKPLDVNDSPQFVPIPIQFDDDDDEDEDAEGDAGQVDDAEERSEFVRINIVEDDEDDNDSAADPDDVVNPLSELEKSMGVDVNATAEDRAVRLKDAGNRYLLSGQAAIAVDAYSQSIALAVSAAALNNRAQAYLLLENFHAAVVDSSRVLELEPDNIKALYRRAKAFFSLGKHAESFEDLRRLLMVDSSNLPAAQLLENTVSMLRTKCDVALCAGDVSSATELMALLARHYQQHKSPIAEWMSLFDSCRLTLLTSAAVDKGVFRTLSSLESKLRTLGVPDTDWQSLHKQLLPIWVDTAVRFSNWRGNESTADIQTVRSVLAEIQSVLEKSSWMESASLVSRVNSCLDAIKEVSSPPAKGTQSRPFASTPSSATKVKPAFEIPTTPARNYFEFERAWKGLRSCNDFDVVRYLELHDAKAFRKVFQSASVNEEVISTLSEFVLKMEDKVCSSAVALKVLDGLRSMPSFALTIQMFSLSTQTSIRRLMEYLPQNSKTAKAIRDAVGSVLA